MLASIALYCFVVIGLVQQIQLFGILVDCQEEVRSWEFGVHNEGYQRIHMIHWQGQKGRRARRGAAEAAPGLEERRP